MDPLNSTGLHPIHTIPTEKKGKTDAPHFPDQAVQPAANVLVRPFTPCASSRAHSERRAHGVDRAPALKDKLLDHLGRLDFLGRVELRVPRFVRVARFALPVALLVPCIRKEVALNSPTWANHRKQ